MMKKVYILLLITALYIRCGQPESQKWEEAQTPEKEETTSFINPESEAFFSKLQRLCGKSFAGEEKYFKEGRESWADHILRIFITCPDERNVHIPLHVGSDKSRTWMFINNNGTLELRHDHRHEDGTPEDLTMYGGFTSPESTALRHVFPADGYTVGMHLSSEGSYWVVLLEEDMSAFHYKLYNKGILLFHGAFDLTKEKNFGDIYS